MEKYEDVVVNFSTSKISLKTEEKENVKKQLEKEKRDLETKEIINSCVNFKQFLEKYKQIHDVSK